MTQVPTTMRAAFEKAIYTHPVTQQNQLLVRSALRRKVGLVTRRSMWSIQRGNR